MEEAAMQEEYVPINDRDYMRDSHPPACTCVECVRKRLERIKREGYRSSRITLSGMLASRYFGIIGLIVIVAILILIFA
jgi:hypothetical protein